MSQKKTNQALTIPYFGHTVEKVNADIMNAFLLGMSRSLSVVPVV